MYHTATLDEALRLAPRLNHTDAFSWRETVARDAHDAQHAGVNVLAVAKEIVVLTVNGLKTVAPDEVSYLDVLRQQVVDEAVSPADPLLRN